MKWMYLLNFKFVDTAFLLCGADMRYDPSISIIPFLLSSATRDFFYTISLQTSIK